jgi:hypothetical protein
MVALRDKLTAEAVAWILIGVSLSYYGDANLDLLGIKI